MTPTVRLNASTTAAFGVGSRTMRTRAGGGGAGVDGSGTPPGRTLDWNPGGTRTSWPPPTIATTPSVVWMFDTPCGETLTRNAVPRTVAVAAGVRTSYFEFGVSVRDTTCQLRPIVCCIVM